MFIVRSSILRGTSGTRPLTPHSCNANRVPLVVEPRGTCGTFSTPTTGRRASVCGSVINYMEYKYGLVL